MITVVFNATTLPDFVAALDILASHPAATMGRVTQAPATSASTSQAPATTKAPAWTGDTSETDGLPPAEYYKRERGERRFRPTLEERASGKSEDEIAIARMENPDWKNPEYKPGGVMSIGQAPALPDIPPPPPHDGSPIF